MLTQQEVDALLADYEARVPIKVIAARYGVDPSYPSKLARLVGLPVRMDEKTRRRISEARRGRRKVQKLVASLLASEYRAAANDP